MKSTKKINDTVIRQSGEKILRIDIKSKVFPIELIDFGEIEELYLLGECEEFPVESPHWHKLKTLSIKLPKFKGDLSSLFKLKSLENLKIIETPIDSFRLPLGHIVSPIKFLTIKGCGLKFLPEEISMLENVKEMNLSENNLESLPQSIVDLKFLKRLNLDSNKFSRFPDHIKDVKGLSYLSLDKNCFSEEEVYRIQREFNLTLHK